VTLEPSELGDLREELGQLREQLQATQEQFSTEGGRVSLVQRSLRCEKSEQKKVKEAQDEPELGHKLENLRQVLGAINGVRGGEHSLEE
jgi:hypothetical protein